MTTISQHELLGGFSDQKLRIATLLAMGSHHREHRIEAIRSLGAGFVSKWLPFAERNLVGPIVADALLNTFGTSFDGSEHCQAVYDESGRRMKTLLSELDGVAEHLHNHGIPMVALKNAGIARGIFPDPALCPMGDLDVLVKRTQFRRAHELILECGFELASRSIVEPADLEHGLLSGGTEYVKDVAGETVWFELQWRPIAGRWIRRDQEPDGAVFIDRSVAIDGTRVRLLCPSDNMIQVCLHTTKHSYVRSPGLRLHTDVDRLVRYQTPNWDEVVTLARQLDVKHSVYFALAMAHGLLDSPVPIDVLHALAPPEWKRRAFVKWMQRVDTFEPDSPKFTRPEMLLFHAMLYDDAAGLAASVFDTDRDHLGAVHLPVNLARAFRRLKDVVTRYQR